ncbi:hypothetical protein TNCV_3383241 [Trichonephila clavipes]|nr:hypothetical protein TNCV_3383241 [Trichonephila clavipes]
MIFCCFHVVWKWWSFVRKSLFGDLSFETIPVCVTCGQLLRQSHAPRRGIYSTLAKPKSGTTCTASSVPYRIPSSVVTPILANDSETMSAV